MNTGRSKAASEQQADVITVNGKEYPLSPQHAGLTLLSYLREHLHLTGTKNGCDKGVCGSCTVVLDGTAVRSCRIPLHKAAERSVLTIEGLQNPKTGALHPLQQSFIDAGAVQCGFCTSGMIMSAYALLLKNPNPSREEIRKALKGNICRCTGYQQIFIAVELAAERMRTL